jgi:hypothetical protein
MQYHLEGTVSHLSSHPDRSEQPTEIVLQTTGAVKTLVQISLDARQDNRSNQIVINSPRCQLPERHYGRTDLLGIIVAPGEGNYQLTIEDRDGRLSGQLELTQKSASITPRMNDLLRSADLGELVIDALQSLESLEIKGQLAGTWEHPQCSIQSNLGHELAQQLSRHLQERQLARLRRELDQAATKDDSQWKALFESMQSQSERIERELTFGENEIERLKNSVAERVKDYDGLVDPNSPLREVYRR